uniref:Microsomal glutathione S-transferase 1 n=1 Tax=Anopheles atroparvus TaxID=41427 RepID=A0AAG5DIY2_ANOAO
MWRRLQAFRSVSACQSSTVAMYVLRCVVSLTSRPFLVVVLQSVLCALWALPLVSGSKTFKRNGTTPGLEQAAMTGGERFRKKVFANEEDLASAKKKDAVPKFDDPDVERVRRAHRNDLENILPFFTMGLLYMLTNPEPFIAINLFRAVAAARILHTIVYAVVVLPQPARGLSWAVAYVATFYMAVKTIVFFL